MKNKIITLIILVIIYILLKYYIPYGNYIIYPINILVTFMHEFGHAFFALITGGDVKGLVVNSNGSGVTTTSGGIRDLVVAGGYLGSAFFGNILLYIGFKKENFSKNIIYFLSFLMILVSIIWFESFITFFILLFISLGLFALTKYTKYDNLILQFLGVSSLLYIIEDFSVGPSSDLSKFSGIIPTSIWMIIWLIIVIAMTLYNLKLIFKKK